ncbi:DEAD/DEAH box helicase [Paenibacillus flagellatus]|uniref:ATP-dependent helicase n=1 Tax=Paenibacillus flagellatus TaxID=2211139 RepID=A0A2V5K099_9BACL|nr:DEAD/DEAH box helicase [Paenibacillus flagellatus]PYI52625.1 ATP-dependent helicase [Paenibacillus flagellatus]
MKTKAAPITVHCKWIASGAFLLTAEQGGFALDAFSLKSLLFAWHEPSFYGTFIETLELDRREGALLPATEALAYFVAPAWNGHAPLRWSDEAKPLRDIARVMTEALEEGRIVPDFDKWKAGSWGWRLRGAGTVAVDPDLAYPPYWDDWMQRIMEERYPERDIVLRGAERRQRAAALGVDVPAAPGVEERRAEAGEAAAAPAPGSDADAPDRVDRDGRREEPEAADVGAAWPEELWHDEDDWLVSIGWLPDETPFRPALRLSEPDTGETWPLAVVLQDRADPERIVECDAAGVPGDDCPDDWRPFAPRVRQAIAKWAAVIPWLRAPSEDGEVAVRTEIDYAEAWDFLAEKSILLAEFGQTVLLPAWWEKLRKTKPRLKAKVRSGVGAVGESLFGLNGIVQFDWKLAIGDAELAEAEFRNLVENNRQLVRIRGRWVLLDPDMLQQVQQWIKQVRKKKGLSFRDVLEMHLLGPQDDEPYDPAEPDRHEALRIEVELNDHLRSFVRQLKQAQSVPSLATPAGFRGSLRHYQVLGASWLLFLRRFGLGGCLADDMGLGKTIQWITYALAVKERDRPSTPSLLICPTSVLGNWQKELERFAPELNVRLHYGPNRAKGDAFAESVRDCDVVLTSYALAHLDEEELTSVRWSSVCLDEAQNIKNAYTKQATSIRKLEADHRIAMTGTPIENRLSELWSIFDFINPGYLGNLRAFTQRYASRIEKTQDKELIGQVQKLAQPFLLRRVKSDPAIELDLPEKLESKTYVSLTVEQATLYENVIADLFDRLDRLPPMERRGMILASLTKLKQICNHPATYTKETAVSADRAARSQKLERLLDMVKELRAEGDRCLVFTQFVEMGQLLQRSLARESGEDVLFLHGGTPKAQRDRMIERFQSGDGSGIFLLSLKAGGIGLNLTAANHVFHYDRWWNPAVENQATDRAFRIGQTKRVQVHKFVTLGTLEEKIDEMIERKQLLSRQIVGSGEQWITELSTDQLKELFALRRQWVEV